MDKLKSILTKFLSLKMWQKALVALIAFVLIVSITDIGGSSDSGKTSDTGSSARQAVVISEIKNCSDNDEDGWYWGACFKSDQQPMTQMDCTIKALDSNGAEVGTHSYRANTVNNGTVVSYGQDVLWYVVSSKSTVQSIKSFDVKCTL